MPLSCHWYWTPWTNKCFLIFSYCNVLHSCIVFFICSYPFLMNASYFMPKFIGSCQCSYFHNQSLFRLQYLLVVSTLLQLKRRELSWSILLSRYISMTNIIPELYVFLPWTLCWFTVLRKDGVSLLICDSSYVSNLVDIYAVEAKLLSALALFMPVQLHKMVVVSKWMFYTSLDSSVIWCFIE
jgi:hypothetical protein